MTNYDTVVAVMQVLMENLKSAEAVSKYYSDENTKLHATIQTQNEEIAELKSKVAGLEGTDGLE